jgi:uncharacterized protein (DUF1330 family)
MRSCYVAALSMLAGAGIGAGTIHALQAQAKPPIYMIGNNEVADPEGYARDYLPSAQASLKAHGARYIAAGKGAAIDGEPPKGRVVIIVWDSMEQLLGWRQQRRARWWSRCAARATMTAPTPGCASSWRSANLASRRLRRGIRVPRIVARPLAPAA